MRYGRLTPIPNDENKKESVKTWESSNYRFRNLEGQKGHCPPHHPIFSRSVHPIPTGGGQIIPTLYFFHLPALLQTITGIYGIFSAISMEKGSKNQKETIYSSKEKIMYVVGNPCNMYKL